MVFTLFHLPIGLIMHGILLLIQIINVQHKCKTNACVLPTKNVYEYGNGLQIML